MNEYLDALKADRAQADAYYQASLGQKSEQQKRLEELLRAADLAPRALADIACGDGGTTRHLARLFPQCRFTLVDLFDGAIDFAKAATMGVTNACLIGDIHRLPLQEDRFDLVVCARTLSWLVHADVAVKELIRICKPGGRVYASSLFNADSDVDVYSTVVDHTRRSGRQGLAFAYNTYSIRSIREWTAGLVSEVRLHAFNMPIDLVHTGRGLGTHTVRLDDGTRLQISGGMLLNWGILELQK